MDLTKPSFNAQSSLLGDTAVLSNHCKAVQTKFAPIIHPSISYHCVGVQVCDTQIIPSFDMFFRAGNNITGCRNKGVVYGGWA